MSDPAKVAGPPPLKGGVPVGAPRSDFPWLLLAAVLFVAVFILRLLVPGTEHPIALLYAIPVLIVAIERGAVAGVAAAGTAIVLAAIWDFALSSEGPHAFEEYAIRAAVVIVLGASVGMLANRLRVSIEAQTRFWDLSTDLLATADMSGHLTHVSPSWTRQLGWSAQELAARPFAEFVHPDDREATFAEFVRILETGEGSDFENRYVCRDGGYRTLQWRAKFEPVTGQIYAAARDITERGENRRRLEAAVRTATEANEAKSEFLSRMSHELRTPLNSILGFTQLLELSDLAPEDREAVMHIHEGGNHLLRLVNEVLEISVIETGHMKITLEPVAAGPLIDEVLTLIEPLAAEVEVELNNSCEPGLAVLADRQRLMQVLINLINNGVKYNRPGGTVTVSCESAGPARAQFVITDDGPGMDAEQISAVFTPFERLGAERGRIEGTGLGLPLAKRLVELMGGTLEPSSEPGRGTTMRVGLAVATGAAGEAGTGAPPPVPISTARQPRKRPRTIVNIEDDDASAELIERALEYGDSVRMISAVSGARGLELVREHRPDLVLLDLDLPDLGGTEVLSLLKQDPRTAAIPVIVVSAAATERQAERLLAAGAAAYLSKPVEIPRLLELASEVGAERKWEPAARRIS